MYPLKKPLIIDPFCAQTAPANSAAVIMFHRKLIGLSNIQKDAEAISRLIKECITPLPQFILKPLLEDGKCLLALDISPGRSTPYYYKADGVMEAYVRVGNESAIAPDYIVNELILKGTNQSFDSLTTDAEKKDYSFTLLEATYLERRGSDLRKIVSETEKLPGYTETYKPEFSSTATDFRVILKNVNYQLSQKNLISDQVSDQVKSQDTLHAVLDFCMTEKSKQEICSFIGYRNLTYFTIKYLNPLLKSGQIKMTIPDKPNSRKQKYITVRTE